MSSTTKSRLTSETSERVSVPPNDAPVRTRPWPERYLFGDEERAAVNRLFDEAARTGKAFGYSGAEERAYGEAFSEFLGGGHADAVNSGTNALFVALAALDLPPYSEVIVPPISDAGGVMPVTVLQCIPVPADAAPGGFNVGPEQIKERITERTSAIIVMHAAGLPADMDGVMNVAREAGLPVVEDCAQAHGSLYRGQPVGTFGETAAFSTMFGKTHAFGGQGGVVFAKDANRYARIREFSDRGKPVDRPKGTRNVVGTLNFSSDELHCAIGRVQLEKLPSIMERRCEVGDFIADGCEKLESIRMVRGLPETKPVYWFLLFRFEAERFRVSKTELVEALKAEGLPFEPEYNFFPCDMDWARNHHSLGTSGLPWSSPQYQGDPEATYELPHARRAVDDHFRMLFHENVTRDDARDVLTALAKVERRFLK